MQWDCLTNCDASMLCRGTWVRLHEMNLMKLGPENENQRPIGVEQKEQHYQQREQLIQRHRGTKASDSLQEQQLVPGGLTED